MPVYETGSIISDRYILMEKIGKGGGGVVFLAEDIKTGRIVALKTLLDKYLDRPDAAVRFIREANALARLDHPGIMKVYDAQQWEGTLFYVMEYVEGKTLRKWLMERKRLPMGSAVRVLCLIADALTHAHRHIIHRDLAPENVMVLPDGSVRLLDFGLAKRNDRFKNLTGEGVNLGRIEYVAPEQQSTPGKVDKRADIYPLGIMFFELLVGRRPKFQERITPVYPALPPEADAFLAKATAPDPNDRFPTAHAYRDELLRVYKIAQGELPSTVRPRNGYSDKAIAWLRRLRGAR